MRKGKPSADLPCIVAMDGLLHDRRPKTIVQCLRVEGGLDLEKYRSYLGYIADVTRSNIANAVAASYEEDEAFGDDDRPAKKRRARKQGVQGRRTEDGELERIDPTESHWYMLYAQNPELDDRFHNKFRRRFRVPFQNYLELVEEAVEKEWFPRWGGSDATGRVASPIELLVLGSLRYLGRGWTFDDIEEATAISEEVHRVFFHQFVLVGSTVLYPRYVIMPHTAEEAAMHTGEFEEAGYPGCVGSSDATHVTMEKCEHRLRNNHLGGKSSLTTRTYNLTVNHRRKILHSTGGGPGRWNDKTLVLFDDFIRGIRHGEHLKDVEFELFERGGNGEVVTVRYTGGYVIVDNGYLRWSITVPPFKVTDKITEVRWSKWLESMRKDVECTFGIMKGRFRILKTGIRVHGVEVADQIWLTCCALHNWLLEVDGLDKPWDGGVPTSSWDGEMGGVEAVPNSVARLTSDLGPRGYDLSGMGPGSDVHEPAKDDASDDDEDGDLLVMDEVRCVRKLGLGFFRRKLVEHFDILWKQNKVKWPQRRGRIQP